MAVAIQTGRVSSWTGVQDSTTPFGHSISFTVDAGSDRMLCVLVTSPGATHPADLAVSYGGVALTAAKIQSFAQNSSHSIWYMAAPPVGTATLLVNRSAWSAASYGFTAFTLENADQTTPFGTSQNYGHSFATSPISAAAVAATGGATLYAAAVNSGGTITGQSGQVEAGTGTPNTTTVLFTHGYKLGASSSVGITWTGGTNQATILAIPVNAVAPVDTTPPVITGPGGATGSTSSISVAENTTAIHTFTADEAVTWSLNGGADVALFSINSSTGALSFISGRDFETPTDADTNNTYIVGVRATDGASNATTQTVTVTVTDVAEGGASKAARHYYQRGPRNA